MSNKNTNSNKQIVNIILRDLISRKKRRKPKPKQEEQPQIEPETLAAAAQRVRPVFFPPTNVIYSNPQGAQQSAMMDVAKQSQLNQYENIRNSLDQGLSEIQDQLAVMQTSGGNPDYIRALEEQLQQYKEYINADPFAYETQSVGASEASVNNESAMSTPYKQEEQQPEFNRELSFQNPIFEEEQIKEEPQYEEEQIKPDKREINDSPYNQDIQLEPPLPEIGTPKQEEWKLPEYSTIFPVRRDGPFFSKDFKTNDDMITQFSNEFEDLKRMYDTIPKNKRYTSAEYKIFGRELRAYLMKYSKAYERILSTGKQKDKKLLDTLSSLNQGGRVQIKYPTFTGITKKLINAMKKAR